MMNKMHGEKNTLEEMISKLEDAGEHIHDLEDRIMKSLNSRRKRMKRNEDRLMELWDNLKHENIHIIGVLEREDRKKRAGSLFQGIIVENLTTWGRKPISRSREEKEVQTK